MPCTFFSRERNARNGKTSTILLRSLEPLSKPAVRILSIVSGAIDGRDCTAHARANTQL